MKIQIEGTRPVMAASYAPAHDWLVGFLGVSGAPVNRPRLAPVQVQLVRENSVHVYGAQLQLQAADLGQKQGINGSMAKAIGMAITPVTTGTDASGVPPRGRPV